MRLKLQQPEARGREDNERVSFRIALRSDVDLLYRTSDKSTDKFEGSVIWSDTSTVRTLQNSDKPESALPILPTEFAALTILRVKTKKTIHFILSLCLE